MDNLKKQVRYHLVQYKKCLELSHGISSFDIELDNGVLSFVPTTAKASLTIMNQHGQYANEYMVKYAYQEANKIINEKKWLFVAELDNMVVEY